MITTLGEMGIAFDMDTEQDVRYCVNVYGDGDHPYCDSKTLPYFSVHYVIDCITRAMKVRIIPDSPRADESTKARLMSAMDIIKNRHNANRKVRELQ